MNLEELNKQASSSPEEEDPCACVYEEDEDETIVDLWTALSYLNDSITILNEIQKSKYGLAKMNPLLERFTKKTGQEIIGFLGGFENDGKP